MKQASDVVNDADPNAITIEQARARILEQLVTVSEDESLEATSALGRVLAQDVVSPMNVPAFRASAMDGYAVRVSDCATRLTVIGQSLAGHPGSDQLQAGTAQRITTGARVPDDADAVVQQENVVLENNIISIEKLPHSGLHIRNPGTDSAKGCVLIKAGEPVNAAELGLLAAHGISQVVVKRKLRIALFSTGDELVEAGDQLANGQIYDSNRALLRALLTDACCDVSDLGIVKDSVDDLNRVFDDALHADLVISSGGVSVGDADFVKDVLDSRGSINLWKIAMKPGRPLTFGVLDQGSLFFGLPGNPVSAALTCLLFVKPAITSLCGSVPHITPPLHLPLTGSLTKNPGRVEYQRARLLATGNGQQWSVTTTGLQDSHVLSSLHKADCLIELPIESSGAQEGELVRVIPFTHYSRSLM